MRFIEFGDKNKPAIILIHGFGITWRMWTKHIDEFKKEYYVIAVVLDGMDEENKTDFISVQKSAEGIIDYVKDNLDGRVFAICGASLGGTIAMDILARKEIEVDKAIIDGGSVAPINKTYLKIGTLFRKWQIKKMAKGNKIFINLIEKIASKELVEEFIKVARFVSEKTIDNVHNSVFTYSLPNSITKTKTKIAYWYGSKEEFHSKKSVQAIRSMVPGAKFEKYQGYDHGELCMKNPSLYIEKAIGFFSNK